VHYRYRSISALNAAITPFAGRAGLSQITALVGPLDRVIVARAQPDVRLQPRERYAFGVASLAPAQSILIAALWLAPSQSKY
jgi:hypothetical protein